MGHILASFVVSNIAHSLDGELLLSTKHFSLGGNVANASKGLPAGVARLPQEAPPSFVDCLVD